MIDSGFHDALGQAKKLLEESPISQLHDLQVERHGDEIYLHGRVHTFYLKQLAQETIRSATRGLQLVNAVDVDA